MKKELNTLKKACSEHNRYCKENVYSAATVLETPRIRAPTIVAPERDVPGNIAAIS